MWKIEQHNDTELTEMYSTQLKELMKAPSYALIFVAVFGICYWWGEFIVNAKVSGFAEYLFSKGRVQLYENLFETV